MPDYGPKISSNGLLFYVDAANNKSYPGSGTDWRDLSGINGTGSLINGPTYSSSDGGGSFSFDGTNDYVQCGNFADNLGEMTISAWMNRPSYGNNVNSKIILSKTTNITTGAGWVFVSGPSTFLFVTQNSGGNDYRVAGCFFVGYNEWKHVVVTLTGGLGGTIKIYINGISQTLYTNATAGTVTNISNSEPVRMCWKDATSVADYFSGKIANVSIYNRALSDVEILQNYNATKTRFGL